MKHFEVYLKDYGFPVQNETILDFNKKCGYLHVLDDTGRLIGFYTENSKEGSVLAVIPIESILYILSVED